MLMRLFHNMMKWWIISGALCGFFSGLIQYGKNQNSTYLKESDPFYNVADMSLIPFLGVVLVGLLVSLYVIIYKHFSQK